MASKKKARRSPPSRRPPSRSLRLPAKDPGVAVLISVIGLLLAAPGIGYLYLRLRRKALMYILAFWALAAVILTLIVIIGTVTMGFGYICFPPIGLVILVCEAVIIYDVYLCATHQKPLLPSI